MKSPSSDFSAQSPPEGEQPALRKALNIRLILGGISAAPVLVTLLIGLRAEVLMPLLATGLILTPIVAYVVLYQSFRGSVLAGALLVTMVFGLELQLTMSKSSTAGLWMLPYLGLGTVVGFGGGLIDRFLPQFMGKRR